MLTIDLRVRRRRDFGHAIGTRGMIGARHHHAGSKARGRVADPFVIGGDDDIGQIAGLRRPLPHVLQHGFARDGDEGFTREA